MRTGLIFAGGRATRLGGQNKALLQIGDRTIIDRLQDALGPLVDEQVALANDDSLRDRTGLRLVHDPTPHAGVLTALAQGLNAAAGDVCLAVACDMPFVSGQLFAWMLSVLETEHVDVVIPRAGDFFEPMHAVYRRDAVKQAIDAALGRGEQRMTSYFADVRVRQVDEPEWQRFDPTGLAFLNVNTPADLDRARRLATAPSR